MSQLKDSFWSLVGAKWSAPVELPTSARLDDRIQKVGRQQINWHGKGTGFVGKGHCLQPRRQKPSSGRKQRSICQWLDRTGGRQRTPASPGQGSDPSRGHVECHSTLEGMGLLDSGRRQLHLAHAGGIGRPMAQGSPVPQHSGIQGQLEGDAPLGHSHSSQGEAGAPHGSGEGVCDSERLDDRDAQLELPAVELHASGSGGRYGAPSTEYDPGHGIPDTHAQNHQRGYSDEVCSDSGPPAGNSRNSDVSGRHQLPSTGVRRSICRAGSPSRISPLRREKHRPLRNPNPTQQIHPHLRPPPF